MRKTDMAKPLLEDGDIIFIRISNFLYRRVADTTRSWESHVGILFQNPDASWVVAESTVPLSKFTPLEKFVARSQNYRFMVKRLHGGLNYDQKTRLQRAAESRMFKFYHLGFNYDSHRLYCSKFVYDAYMEATGLEIGRLQTFKELLSENLDAPLGFWRLWFFGFIPWDRKCVTTSSQLKDDELETIFDSEVSNQIPKPVSQRRN